MSIMLCYFIMTCKKQSTKTKNYDSTSLEKTLTDHTNDSYTCNINGSNHVLSSDDDKFNKKKRNTNKSD